MCLTKLGKLPARMIGTRACGRGLWIGPNYEVDHTSRAEYVLVNRKAVRVCA